MKKFILIFLLSIFSYGTEGYLCSSYFNDVVRKVKNIQNHQNNLSKLALNKLLKDLRFDVKQCISECEGYKFDYCNDIAKKFFDY
jgi:hypothetical protein